MSIKLTDDEMDQINRVCGELLEEMTTGKKAPEVCLSEEYMSETFGRTSEIYRMWKRAEMAKCEGTK